MGKLTDADRKTIVKWYQEGMDMRSIAKEFGVTFPTIALTLKKMGVKARRSGTRFFHINADRPPDDRIRNNSAIALRDLPSRYRVQMSPDAVTNSLKRTGTRPRDLKAAASHSPINARSVEFNGRNCGAVQSSRPPEAALRREPAMASDVSRRFSACRGLRRCSLYLVRKWNFISRN